MKLTDSQIEGLNVACDEATWIGLEINQEQSWAGITLAVLTLPEEGLPPEDSRVQFILQPLCRVAASYRNGLWNDENAATIPLTVRQLEQLVVDRQSPIYGCEFFNAAAEEEGFSSWSHRLSLDMQLSNKQTVNTINLFQDTNSFLQVRIWFGELLIFNPERQQIFLEQFVAGGKRWWDGLYSGDPRTNVSGIIPLKRSSD